MFGKDSQENVDLEDKIVPVQRLTGSSRNVPQNVNFDPTLIK